NVNLTVTSCTATNNTTNGAGGGINSRNATINSSTISGNSANLSGGGIYSNGSLTLADSTISGNTAGDNGGGISGGAASFNGLVTRSTIAANSADAVGGGIFIETGHLTLDHTIVATNISNALPGSELAGLLGAAIEAHYSLIGFNRGSGLAEAHLSAPDAN